MLVLPLQLCKHKFFFSIQAYSSLLSAKLALQEGSAKLHCNYFITRAGWDVSLKHGLLFCIAEAASGNTYRDQVQHHQPADGDIASVQLIAGCNLQQGGTQFCRGRLGVQPLPHAAHGGEDKVQSLDAEQQANAIAHDMVVTTSDGQVFALSSIHATGQVQEVDAEAPQPDLQQHKWESSLSASRTVQLARMQSAQVDVNDCVLDTGTG